MSKKKKVLFFWTVEWCFTWEYNSWLTWFLSAKYYYFIVSLRGLIVVPLYIIRLPFLDLKVSLSLVLFSFFMCLNADFFFMYLPWDLCLLNLMSSIHSGKISASIFEILLLYFSHSSKTLIRCMLISFMRWFLLDEMILRCLLISVSPY